MRAGTGELAAPNNTTRLLKATLGAFAARACAGLLLEATLGAIHPVANYGMDIRTANILNPGIDGLPRTTLAYLVCTAQKTKTIVVQLF